MPSSPEYRGHFKVGFVDIESPQVSHVKAGLLTRIYYPSNEVATPKRMGNWLPNNWLYSKGYGGFIGISTWLISLVIYPVLCLTRTPALPHLKIAGKDKFPVVFFSHGLGGMRTTYSQTLGNLASRGFIVVAMEHADGSACITARNLKEIEYYRPLKEHLDDPDFQYLTIKRREQIEQRTDETVQTFAFIKELNSGKAEVLDSIGKDFLPQLIGKFDFDNAVMIGHSFGAATSINVCSSTDLDFKCCVLLDPWMFSVKENSLFHWAKNLDSIKTLISNPAYHPSSIFGYIKNTRHQDFSDLSLFFPWLCRKANVSGSLDPQTNHLVQDQLKHITISGDASKGLTYDTDQYCVFGEQAFEDLYAAMSTTK